MVPAYWPMGEDQTIAAENVCVLCSKSGSNDDTVALTKKGCDGLISASKQRDETIEVTIGQKVHKACRRDYTLKRNVAKKRKCSENTTETVTRRSAGKFNFKTDCLFCGKEIPKYIWTGKKCNDTAYQVRTKAFQNSIHTKCLERNDDWGKQVLARVEYSQDLVASDAVYHRKCSTAFRLGREGDVLTDETPSKKAKRVGRLPNEQREEAFQKVIEYIEDNDFSQSSVYELVAKMNEHLDKGCKPFTAPHMKSRLTEHFGSRLFISEVSGKKNVVSLHDTASKIIHSFYNTPKDDDTDLEKLKIITTAAKLIKSEIKQITQDTSNYPSCADISTAEKTLEYLPESLYTFLHSLIVAGKNVKLKQAAIGQAIIQSVCPKAIIAPLQISLAIQLHLQYGSRFLIDSLHEMGFCSSYSEVLQYEKNAAATQTLDIPGYTPGKFVQFIGDNVDHNCRTLDGQGTFHGMGIISSITPDTKCERIIPRATIASADLSDVAKISIYHRTQLKNESLVFRPLPTLIAEDITYNIDVLWKVSWLLRPQTPLWNGTMQMVHDGDFPGVSSVMFLPMIDMDPNNESCIYSTLRFIAIQAKKYAVSPIITFDQPLWWKAQCLVDTEPIDSPIKNTVLRLGGLHVEMSFLGSIGHLMTDSGLKELLQTVYAENTVPHMLSGKAISRAIRGHALTEKALLTLIVSNILNFDLYLHEGDYNIGLEDQEIGDENKPVKFSNETESFQSTTEDMEIYGEQYKTTQRNTRGIVTEDLKMTQKQYTIQDDIEDVSERQSNMKGTHAKGEYTTMTVNRGANGDQTESCIIHESEEVQINRGIVQDHIEEDSVYVGQMGIETDKHNDICKELNDSKTMDQLLCKTESTEVSEDGSIDIASEETNITFESNTVSESESDLHELSILENAMKLFDSLVNKSIDVNAVLQAEEVQKVVECLNETIKSFQGKRTAMLWLQYIDMLDILKKFIKAERTGNWLLHLQAMRDMLPYFAASGHNAYTKCTHVYLNNMLDIESTHPAIHAHFLAGYHVIRRSKRYWAGLSSDLVIEQMLMRTIKTVGGLTRGRGIDEKQRATWIMSRPACAEVNNVMQQLTGLKHVASEQHQDCASSRITKDQKDTQVMISYLIDRNPFRQEAELRSISSGVIANKTVNVDTAKEIGEGILTTMEGRKAEEYSFRKSKQAVIMSDSATVKVGADEMKVDPQLLFQRLISAAQGSVPIEDLDTFFSFELCTFPPALFENVHIMREANKATLGKDLLKLSDDQHTQLSDHKYMYVIDGGSLLQKIAWPKGHTYEEICQIYVKYITEKYDNCTVVFDGYDHGPSTKDNTHRRRTGGQCGAEIRILGDMKMNTNKQKVLLNKKNKQNFINLLSSKLTEAEVTTIHSAADADYLIVKTAVDIAEESATVVLAEDTDILVLLCFHGKNTNNKLYLKTEGRKGKCVDINLLRQNLGPEICNNLLFIHSFLGCDTVSKPSGIGKATGLKLYNKNKVFQRCADVFNKIPAEVTEEEIVAAGEMAMLCVYNGEKASININHLRVVQFLDKVARNTVYIDPKLLPPTASACRYHSLRTYHQILEWKGIVQDPTKFGWKLSDLCLVPITSDMPPAPAHILNVVRCSCKAGCKTLTCSCRKMALPCSVVCRHCNGTCNNWPKQDVIDDEQCLGIDMST